ncbi:ATP synthase protein I [Kushneria sinocarnis]|uniref:ATP synthase protein I n=1 Tax=Kushneria sinocarnis TaxID=595502 RepID=A0A420X075_9GAMM|nr:ATP synthase subunit I [Kushneria sinocarnis]RKR07251.1 ATP synthase protein I [Kushneria sinocarnis]
MRSMTPARPRRPQVGRLLLGQTLTGAAVSLLALILGGVSDGLSAVSGALVCLLPNAYFAWRAFRLRGARLAREIMNGFYRAEAGKFGLTVALFTLVFVAVPPSNPAFFFGAYVLVQCVHWLGFWLVRTGSRT